jgi:hypothetical protein
VNYLGIDPGKQGAAFLIKDSGITHWWRGEDFLEGGEWSPLIMRLFFEALPPNTVAAIEQCHAFPGISASANASVMFAYGMWIYGLKTAGLAAVHEVPSQTWKKWAGIQHPVKKGATKEDKAAAYRRRKELAVAKAHDLFPRVSFISQRGALLDGIAEAAIIASYGRFLCKI